MVFEDPINVNFIHIDQQLYFLLLLHMNTEKVQKRVCMSSKVSVLSDLNCVVASIAILNLPFISFEKTFLDIAKCYL